MAPQVPALAQSESKARFFARLGLDLTNGTHRRVYNMMKMEAAEGRKRLLANQGSSTAPIHEDAWQREILYIYNTAQPQTLAVYQFGHDTVDPDRPDNWIIRWMLWHVFRYRDYRNKQNRLKDAPSDDDDESERSSAKGSRRSSNDAAASAGPSNAPKAQASPTPPRTYWDPVREQ